jgi:Rad3-related DNA helicase
MNQYRSNEQREIAKRIEAYLKTNNADEPLLMESTPGIGKTRAYLIPTFAAAAAGKKAVIALPTWMLIEQLLRSSDMAAAKAEHPNITVGVFRPASQFDARDEYKRHAETAKDADILIVTSAAVAIDNLLRGNYCGAIKRDIRVFDEADQLPDMAALMKDRTLDAKSLADLGIKAGTFEEVIAQVIATQEAPADVKKIAKDIQQAMKRPGWWQEVGFNKNGDAKLFNKLPGRLLKKVANRNGSIFISATLSVAHGSFIDFEKALGIQTRHMLSASIEPAKHGDIKFFVADNIKYGEEGHEDLCVRIINTAAQPTLVATPSFALAEALGARCPQAYVRQRGEKIGDAVDNMQRQGKHILIATAAWAGLDTPVQWKSVVIPQVPFPAPVEIDGDIVSNYFNGRNTATRRLKQVMGRGTRFPDSTCNIYLLDARYKYEGIPAFVPARFKESFDAAIIVDGAEFRAFVEAA